MSAPNPYARWIATTASATAFSEGICDAIYVGAAGTITVTTQDDTSCAIPVPAGGYVYGRFKSCTSLGAATSVFRLYW